MTNAQERWEMLPDIDNETIKTWLDQLLEDKHKMHVEELTHEEIKAEIEETKGSMVNFKAWGDRHGVIDCEEYIEVLEELLAVCTTQYVIKIIGDKIYVNDKLCYFSAAMDKEDHEDDLNKKAILALADEMGYEATFLFEEMAYRLEEMLNEEEETSNGNT
jgi:hypothetical protein